jgi:uncharacterized membrane protein (Fun14 family)
MELADLLDGTTGDMSVALIQGLIVGVIIGVIADNISSRIKWFLIIQFIVFKLLESQAIIIIDWDRLTMGLLEYSAEATVKADSLLATVIEMGAFSGSFVAGMILGKKIMPDD